MFRLKSLLLTLGACFCFVGAFLEFVEIGKSGKIRLRFRKDLSAVLPGTMFGIAGLCFALAAYMG